MKKLLTITLVLLALVAIGCTEENNTFVSPTEPPAPVTVLGSCFAENFSIFCLDSSTGDLANVKWAASLGGIVRTATTGSPGAQVTLTVTEPGNYVVSQEVTAADGSALKGNDIPVAVSG